MANSTTIVLDCTLFVLAAYFIRRLIVARSSDRLPFPPGPPGLPIIKNLLDWPTSNEWEVLYQWGKKYGDMVHADVGGNHMLVVNSIDIAMELLQGKGNLYCDRPVLHVGGELAGLNQLSVFMDEGPAHKESRRFFAQELGTKALSARFVPLMEARIREFTNRLLGDPEVHDRLPHHIFSLTSGVILEATYGYNIKNNEDEILALGKKTLENMALVCRPGAFLAEAFPWIDRLPSWFPGMEYRQIAAMVKEQYHSFRDIPFKYTQQHILDEESVQQSFVAKQLQNQDLAAEEEANLRATAALCFAGGADTSVSVFNYFFFFMTKHPEVQTRAQEEIDRIVGTKRLPSISDRPDLPYVEALISEVLRCGSVTPFGIPHKLRVDDVHNGYFIPKGTIVLPNMWFMSLDPRYYKNPKVFDPSRFLGPSPESDPREWVFGFGRRACPGRVFAEQSLFLTISTVLATLRISKANDALGKEIDPVMDHHSEGVVMTIKPYTMKITVRSSDKEALLKPDYFVE